MTLTIPKETWADRILKRMGKTRLVRCRMDYRRVGHYAFFGAKKESFFIALLAPKNRRNKEGWVPMDQLLREIEEEKHRVMPGVKNCIQRAEHAAESMSVP